MYTENGNSPVNSDAPDHSSIEMEAGSSISEPVPSASGVNQNNQMHQSIPPTSWGLTEVVSMEEVSSSSTANSEFDGYQQALRAMEADPVKKGNHGNQDWQIAASEKRRWQRRERRARQQRHYQHKLKELRKTVKNMVDDVERRAKEAALRAEIEASIGERIILLHILPSPPTPVTPPQSISSKKSPKVIVERIPLQIDASMYPAILERNERQNRYVQGGTEVCQSMNIVEGNASSTDSVDGDIADSCKCDTDFTGSFESDTEGPNSHGSDSKTNDSHGSDTESAEEAYG